MIKVVVAFGCFILLVGCNQKGSAVVDACESNVGIEGVIRAARTVEILDKPGGDHILNTSGTHAVGHAQFYEIESSEPIEHICSMNGWAKIHDSNLAVIGWVRASDIEPVPRDKSGARIYDEKDIVFMDDDWSSREKSLKSKLIVRYNELAKECNKLEPLIMKTSDSREDRPTFNFTCDDGVPHFISYHVPENS